MLMESLLADMVGSMIRMRISTVAEEAVLALQRLVEKDQLFVWWAR